MKYEKFWNFFATSAKEFPFSLKMEEWKQNSKQKMKKKIKTTEFKEINKSVLANASNSASLSPLLLVEQKAAAS